MTARLRTRWIVLALVASAGALVVGAVSARPAGVWATVERHDLDRVAPFEGRLRASSVTEYGPPDVAQIWDYRISFIAPEGAEVATGDPVLRFDTSELEQRLRRYHTTLEAAQKEYQQRKKEFETQERELEEATDEAKAEERRAELAANVPEDLVARSQLEKSAVDLGLARQEIEHNKQQIAYLGRRSQQELGLLRDRRDRAAAAITQTEAAIESMTVRAEQGGTVLHHSDRRGNRKKVGDSCWRGVTVLEIPQPGAMKVDAWVEEAYSGDLEVGQTARLRLDAHPDRELRAKVILVMQTVEHRSELSGGPIVRLQLALEDDDPELVRPGMRVHGSVLLEDRDPVLAVPIEAVEAGPAGPSVAVRGFLGAQPRTVVLGRRSGDWVEVTAGLGEGDEVMIRR